MLYCQFLQTNELTSIFNPGMAIGLVHGCTKRIEHNSSNSQMVNNWNWGTCNWNAQEMAHSIIYQTQNHACTYWSTFWKKRISIKRHVHIIYMCVHLYWEISSISYGPSPRRYDINEHTSRLNVKKNSCGANWRPPRQVTNLKKNSGQRLAAHFALNLFSWSTTKYAWLSRLTTSNWFLFPSRFQKKVGQFHQKWVVSTSMTKSMW